MTENWIRCPRCSLQHRPRPEGRCPRCDHPIEPQPVIEPDLTFPAVTRIETLASAARDPALGPKPEPLEPARLRLPAILAGFAGLAVLATANLAQANWVYSAFAAALALASFAIARFARA